MAQVLQHRVLVVGREIDGVDMAARRRQVLAQRRVHRVHGRLVVVAPADARLVGDDDHQIAQVIQAPDRLGSAGNPLDVLDRVHIALVDVEHPVAVEEGGGARRRNSRH